MIILHMMGTIGDHSWLKFCVIHCICMIKNIFKMYQSSNLPSLHVKPKSKQEGIEDIFIVHNGFQGIQHLDPVIYQSLRLTKKVWIFLHTFFLR